MKSINELAEEIHGLAVEKGWWEHLDRNVGEQLMLATTELAEAMEEYRKDPLDLKKVYYTTDANGNDKPEGFGIELADVIIRLLDTANRYGIDLEACIAEKFAYNRTRPYRHGNKAA